jgi:hypothetical protein
MARASNRLRKNERFFTARRPIPSYLMKGAVLVGHTAAGAPLTPLSRAGAKPCLPSKNQPLTKTACKSEVFFTTDGPKLRFCYAKKKPGPTVPVSSPAEATRLANAFCACVKQKGSTAKACAVKLGGSSLGRYSKKRRRS